MTERPAAGSFVSRVLVVLLLCDLAIWAGFFVLTPFLPERITSLGHSGTVVGLILAVRLLSQQGTMVVSGALADRWGYRRALLGGLAIRACGFAQLALATSAPMLALAAILSGVGGSLIGAAFKASYTTAPGTADLAARFLWLAVADRLGQVIGPMLGAAAPTFTGRAYLAVALFLAVALVVMFWLPEQAPHDNTTRPVLENVLGQLRNRRLAGLVAVLCGYWALQQQMSVLIPLAATKVGRGGAVGTLFSISALAGLALILLLPKVRMDRLWHQLYLAQAITTLSMTGPLLLPGYAGIVLVTVGLAVAAVIGQPAMDALVGSLSPPETRGSAYGFAALSFGVGGALGQVLGGWAWTLSATGFPWILFAALGLLTLLCLRLLKRGSGYV